MHNFALAGTAIKCDNEGESVKVSLLSHDPCITCKCQNHEIVCQREACRPDEEGQCVLSEKLQHFRTFDGKNYTFDGKCNYIVARDCKSKSFSVHLINQSKHSSMARRNNYTSKVPYKAVMVKIDQLKVRLGKLGRIRVGRKRVKLPHIKLGILSIVQDGTRVVIRTNMGKYALIKRLQTE